jgi:hypothetical protein
LVLIPYVAYLIWAFIMQRKDEKSNKRRVALVTRKKSTTKLPLKLDKEKEPTETYSRPLNLLARQRGQIWALERTNIIRKET